MKTTIIPPVKKIYTTPTLEVINLDTEISLALMSYPEDPGDMSNAGTNGFINADCLWSKPFDV